MPFKPGFEPHRNVKGRPTGAKAHVRRLITKMWENSVMNIEDSNPLDVLVDLMLNSDKDSIKLAAASELASYLFPKAPKELTLKHEGEVITMTLAQAQEKIQHMLTLEAERPSIDAVFEEIVNESN